MTDSAVTNDLRSSFPAPCYETQDSHLQETAWTNIPFKAKLVLSTSVDVLYLTTAFPHWRPAEILISEANPSILLLNEPRKSLKSLNFLQIYQSRVENDEYGIKVGATPLIVSKSNVPSDVSPEQILTFRSFSQETSLILPTSIYGDWKKALSSYIKSYFRLIEQEETSFPRTNSDLTLCSPRISVQASNFGSIFDISWMKLQEKQLFEIKLTCVNRFSETHFEYFLYEKEGKSGGKSTEMIKTEVENGQLDAANYAIFAHFLAEMEIMNLDKPRKNQEFEYFSCLNSDIRSILSPGFVYDWVKIQIDAGVGADFLPLSREKPCEVEGKRDEADSGLSTSVCGSDETGDYGVRSAGGGGD